MFLKSIILQGFKSFATKTVINFDSDFTGIVGPNGCGKSNIIDAIKWVLGEQSAKNMRGSSMSDVVFQGSSDKKGVNMCEVTLCFDNSKHQLNSEYDQLEVTRRLYKDTNESEYFINKTQCRLKDIVDLTLDSGLGKDSLSIITQGNIQQFAEAKPIERRALFEEAAGVAKYKKKKIESLNKLARTQENIDRLNDVLTELERQVTPLKKQALKAEKYVELKNRLTEIEVAVIVNDISTYIQDLETVEQQIFDLSYQQSAAQSSIQIMENDANDLKDETNALDNEVQKLQDRLLKVLAEIQVLERRKVEINEKRKYIVQTGTDQARIEQVKSLLEDAKKEYDDRISRKDKTEAEVELLDKNIEDYEAKIAEIKSKLEEDSNTAAHLSNRKSVLDNLIKSPYENQAGVKAVIASKNALAGIYDTVSNLFRPDEGYEGVIGICLASSLYHIVTKDVDSAKNAIRFLKKNKAGNATFLPLDVLKPRYVNKDQLFICENSEGFIGLASDFVDCDEMFDVVVLSLLGNVIITDNLDNATKLASRLNYQYRIVTMDGDVISRGGSLTGGYNKNNESPLTYANQLNEVSEKLNDLNLKMDSLTAEYVKLMKSKNDDEQSRYQAKLSLASLNEVIGVKRAKYDDLKLEYDRIKPDGETQQEQSYENEVINDLNKAYAEKDEITLNIQNKRERRVAANNGYQRKYNQLRQQRSDLNRINDSINNVQIEKTKMIANRDNLVERLARDYSMTYEYAAQQKYEVELDTAREEVIDLRQQIADLGNINLDAPASFEEVNERYESLNSNLNDLTEAKTTLLGAIAEMDDVMKVQFSEMFDKINGSLNEVFTVLFGGGRAKLILEDPDDILNTGIDIDVQPPGKTIQNIRLFSGGEKSLIAICVLFAILKARPIPLCIFDEIEASLDQGNVDRFARYIHQFSNDSQFIVITHRPGTMAECDVLYGITMQSKGVSNVIKVKLKEALDYAMEGNENGTA